MYFEDQNEWGLLTQVIPDGADWWVGNDGDFGGTSTPYPGIVSEFTEVMQDSTGYLGKGMKVQFNVGTEGSQNFSLVGLDLGNGTDNLQGGQNWADLSNMTAFKFWAKGSGNILIGFKTKFVKVDNVSENHYSALINLTDDWTQYRVTSEQIHPGENFVPSIGSEKTWDEVKDAVGAVFFQANDSATLYLDEIELEGVQSLVFE